MEKRTSVYIGQHGVDPNRGPVFKREERMQAGTEGGSRKRSRKKGVKRSTVRTSCGKSGAQHSTTTSAPPSPAKLRKGQHHPPRSAATSSASPFLPIHPLDRPPQGAFFLHHGRRRGRLGLHLQDGDGRRVGFRVIIHQDEDPASG